MSKKVSLAELMGKGGAQLGKQEKLSLKHLPDILGEALPELPRTPVGRHRLVRALQQRFGNNFRSLPGVGDLVKEFDGDMEFEKRIAKIGAVKYVPTKKGK